MKPAMQLWRQVNGCSRMDNIYERDLMAVSDAGPVQFARQTMQVWMRIPTLEVSFPLIDSQRKFAIVAYIGDLHQSDPWEAIYSEIQYYDYELQVDHLHSTVSKYHVATIFEPKCISGSNQEPFPIETKQCLDVLPIHVLKLPIRKLSASTERRIVNMNPKALPVQYVTKNVTVSFPVFTSPLPTLAQEELIFTDPKLNSFIRLSDCTEKQEKDASKCFKKAVRDSLKRIGGTGTWQTPLDLDHMTMDDIRSCLVEDDFFIQESSLESSEDHPLDILDVLDSVQFAFRIPAQKVEQKTRKRKVHEELLGDHKRQKKVHEVQ